VRHLYGTALASVMTAVMFFAGAWGYLQLLRLPVSAGGPAALPGGGGSLLSNGSVLLALAAVLGTGILAGVLVAVPRISPLAAGLPGLLLIAWTGLYLASVRHATQIIPLRTHAFGAGWEALLFNGVLGAVGLGMVIPLFVPSRWRGRQVAEDADLEAMTAESDDFLAGLKDAKGQRGSQARRQAASALVGTVVPRSLGDTAQPVEITRVTGASRALRGTGPLRAATGSNPSVGQTRSTGPIRTTGSFRTATGQFPASDPNPSGSQPRATGAFRPRGRNQQRPGPAGNS